jgi:hypothetical protein
MSTPKTIARIAESGFVWKVFRESRLFPRSSIEDGTIREAVSLLDREIASLGKDRPDRDRKRKARERLMSICWKNPGGSSAEADSPYQLQTNLRQYTRQVIDIAWPLQRRGIVPVSEGVVLSDLQTRLSTFEPRTEGQKALYAEALRGFDQVAELRGRRLQSVRAHRFSNLPAASLMFLRGNWGSF